jgi:iron complex transport system ATP-binding protein
MKSAISVENLSFAYEKKPVLKNISFSIYTGDFFIIIGPNGSGKTTLMKILAGTLKPQSGQLDIFGSAIQTFNRKSLARTIALVPQMVPLEFPFNVLEFVLMGRYPHLGLFGWEQSKDFEVAEQAMEFTDLKHLARRKMNQLSGGERQRVLISRAICQQSQIILLDEPTASLDLAYQVQVMDLMEKLKEETGTTVIMVSHDVNLAALYGTKLMLLKDGQIVKQGQPEDVLTFQNLELAYGCKLLVDESPLGNSPRVTLVPKKFLAQSKDYLE